MPRIGHTTQQTPESHDEDGRAGGARASAAGLVLLYAAAHAELTPAYPFRKSEIVVGREDSASDLPIPIPSVSRRHATLVRSSDGSWTVVDESSRNGTFVDGVRITTRAPLRHLSRVRFGEAIFKFVAHDADAYVPYCIDGMVRGAPSDGVEELIGGRAMRTLAHEIERIARTDLSCVILGETGTGKEVVARAVHRLSRRPGPLQAINCAAVPANLFESELFGYKRGAFSGADRDKPGLVQGAEGGTLFLDEIGETPLEMQPKLLRLLQQRELVPLGAARPEIVDVRVIAATHRDLAERAFAGSFRGDLFARLNEHSFVVPPLRERKEDVLMLAIAFGRKYGKRPITFSFEAMDALLAYDWPFNVRELESAMKRAVALSDSESMGTLTLGRRDLPPQVLGAPAAPAATHGSRPPPAGAGGDDEDETEDDGGGFHRGPPKEAMLRKLLTDHGGNIAAVARTLGKRRMQVQRYMQKYAIAPSAYRKGAPDPDDHD